MRRTRAGILIITGVLGVIVGFGVDQVLTATGRATFTPVPTLAILLVLLAGVVLVLALPIRRATRGSGRPVDPFRALRIAVLSKASSLVGAGVAGVAVGLAVFVLTRPVSPPLGSLSAIVATALSGGVLVAAGLLAEHWCTIRKDEDDDTGTDPGPDAAGHP